MISKKGITPIIAVILLLMMTIAGAAAAFFWFVRMQSELQGGTETFNEDLSTRISSRIEVVSADAQLAENVTLFLKNQGTKTVSLSGVTMTMILKNADNQVICSSKMNDSAYLECDSGCETTDELTRNEIQSIHVTLDGSGCTATPVLSELYYYTIDFGGDTATGGRFNT